MDKYNIVEITPENIKKMVTTSKKKLHRPIGFYAPTEQYFRPTSPDLKKLSNDTQPL